MRRERVSGADRERSGYGESKRAEALPRHCEDRDFFSRSRTREELRVGADDALGELRIFENGKPLIEVFDIRIQLNAHVAPRAGRVHIIIREAPVNHL